MQQNTHHDSQDLKESPNSLKLKLVNSINDQESNSFLKQSDEALSLKKALLTLNKIVHSRHEDKAWNLVKKFIGGSFCPDPREAIKVAIIYMGFCCNTH